MKVEEPSPGQGELQQAVALRRAALDATAARGADLGMPPPAQEAPLWGLALSGGGIRSATFCLGLLRSLAANRLLLRFDLLSTVSGGGYIGGMLGRLFDRARTGPGADEVDRALAQAEKTHFGWWLRTNGRYLTPAGARDTLFALALYLRNLIGIHVEFGVLAVLLALGLCAVDLAAWQTLATVGSHEPRMFAWTDWIQPWMPTLWPLAAIALLPALNFLLAYWQLQWIRARSFGAIVLGAGAILVAAGLPAFALYRLGQLGDIQPQRWHAVAMTAAALFLLLNLGAALTARWIAGGPGGTVGAARNALTHGLSRWLSVFGACLGLGLVERLAWVLAFDGISTLNLGVALGVAAVGLRGAAPLFAAEGHLAPRWVRGIGTWLLQGVGYLLSLCMVVWWTALVMKVVMRPVFIDSDAGVQAGTRIVTQMAFTQGWIHLALLVVPVLGYALLTGRNVQFLNLSSLHAFYAARLTRAYLGAANGTRFGPDVSALSPIAGAVRTGKPAVSVGEVAFDDDVPLGAYAPHRAGGPVHLINSCVNQSADDKGRLFNRDRKGLLLSVMAGGASQLGQEGWRRIPGIGQLSLGAWLAISGAAVSPGLGARTQRGLSALLTFAGVRLGYWLTGAARHPGTRAQGGWWRRNLAKSIGLLHETTGTFAAAGKNDWFISDGGHFENTGGYALLAARAQFILLADCGADPDYRFGDLEDLVRKARVDLDTHITFQKPAATPAAWWETLKYFGSLNALASSDSNACLALATIRYPQSADGTTPATGILIVVKPNMCAGLPMDIENYRLKAPNFPQQPTSDQFFSEAQWESYFSLGRFLADKLSTGFVDSVVKNPRQYFEPDDHTKGEASSQPDKSATPTQVSTGIRLPPRIGVAAVGATLSAGALATIGISAWQAAEGLRNAINSRIVGERAAMKELAQLWAQLPRSPDPAQEERQVQAAPADSGRGSEAISALAMAVVRSADAYCQRDEARWLQTSALGVRIVRDASVACQRLGSQMGNACNVLLSASHGPMPSAFPTCMTQPDALPAVRYWGHDYSPGASWEALHPCSPRREAMVLAEEAFQASNDHTRTNPSISRSALDELRDSKCPPRPAPAAPRHRLPLPTTTSAIVAAPSPDAPPAPTAVETPAPMAASTPAAWKRAETICKRITIYVQIYGGAQRDSVRGLRDWWRNWGASVPPIEDVYDAARRTGRANPAPVTTTVLRYHDTSGRACAYAIAAGMSSAFGDGGEGRWIAEPLAPALKATPGVVELWVRPNDPLLAKMNALPPAAPPAPSGAPASPR
ncbi:hypothetical protein [Pseudacidovorax intermedius]|uniref:hypothetical protein n=1 Tax=Pseudacidovorax intermedius TaxID=433924 RepID=UPI0026F06566|nr:hypothetical protein [Pseudacidovorax intermedius]